MIKAVLLDADNVVIAKHPYFSQRLQDEFGIPLEKTLPFFKGRFRECTMGRADLKQEISKCLADWGWQKTVEELLEEWFKGEYTLNEAVMQLVSDLRSRGIKCFLVSDNEKYRADYVAQEMGLGARLDGSFFSCNLNCYKSQPEFFEKVIAELGLKPEEVAYFDDEPDNVAAAQTLGIKAGVYSDASAMDQKIKELLS